MEYFIMDWDGRSLPGRRVDLKSPALSGKEPSVTWLELAGGEAAMTFHLEEGEVGEGELEQTAGLLKKEMKRLYPASPIQEEETVGAGKERVCWFSLDIPLADDWCCHTMFFREMRDGVLMGTFDCSRDGKKEWKAACRKQGPAEKTAYVSWELLRSRLLVQKDEYRIMRYGKEWFLSGGYEAGTTDVSLIMEIYHGLERRLREDAKRYAGKIAALRAEEHTAYLLRPFHEYVKELIQYAVTDATELEAFRELRKEERFQIRVGECLEPGYLVYMENRGKTREELLKKSNSNRRKSHCYEDFQQMGLSGLQLAAGDFRNADFRDTALEESNLCLSILAGARFRRSRLRGAKLSGSMMHGADFTKADRHAHMEGILLCDGMDGRAEGGSGTEGSGNWSSTKTYTAEEANKWWKETMNYDNPPYKPGTTVTEIQLVEDTTFVRVYDGNTSGQFGGWLMKMEDIKGLTPMQIQDKFALPSLPKYVTDVKLPAGTQLRTGVVNPLEGWGSGGATQFDLMGQRVGEFVNPRPLP